MPQVTRRFGSENVLKLKGHSNLPRWTRIGRPFAPFLFAVLVGSLLSACSEAPLVAPVEQGAVDSVQVVIGGRVTDPSGAPVAGAVVVVRTSCPMGPSDPCAVSTTRSADEEGRFVAWFERRWNRPLPAVAEVVARPPIGRGYFLGDASLEGVEVEYQPKPAADTTSVELTLPSARSASRSPEWVRNLSHRLLARPLTVDSRRVYGSGPGCVGALDRFTGATLWCEGSAPGLAGLPYVVVDEVVAMSRGETFSGLRASSGEVLWTRAGVPNHPFVGEEGHGLAATDGMTIAVYDPETGATRWDAPIEQGRDVNLAMGSGVVCAERLVAPPGDARIQCWDAFDGEFGWSRFIGSPGWIGIAGERIVLSGGETERESGWIALDKETGATVWKSPLPARSGSFSETGDRVFACSGSECVAVRIRDGSIVWRRTLQGEAGSPVVGGGRVYVVVRSENRGSLYVLDAASGGSHERIDPDPFDLGGFCARPAVHEDWVYVFGCSGHLYAFEVGRQ